MAAIHDIQRAKRRKLFEASEAYHSALSEEVALSVVEIVEREMERVVGEITSKIAIESTTPFIPGKVWFDSKELKARWGCTLEFIKSIPDTKLKPHHLGNGMSMKSYLAVDVYRYEGLISRTKHKELKSI